MTQEEAANQAVHPITEPAVLSTRIWHHSTVVTLPGFISPDPAFRGYNRTPLSIEGAGQKANSGREAG